jgi:hypothetical protein
MGNFPAFTTNFKSKKKEWRKWGIEEIMEKEVNQENDDIKFFKTMDGEKEAQIIDFTLKTANLL